MDRDVGDVPDEVPKAYLNIVCPLLVWLISGVAAKRPMICMRAIFARACDVENVRVELRREEVVGWRVVRSVRRAAIV